MIKHSLTHKEAFALKLEAIQSCLRQYPKSLIALSGGVDSALLCYLSFKVLGREGMAAVIGVSPSSPQWDRDFARAFCEEHGVPYRILATEEFKNKEYTANPANRCFFCKKELFSKMRALTRDIGFSYIMDGTNTSDLSDYRPGLLALKEEGVISPFVEAGISKADIRLLSQGLSLAGFDRPSSPCLASRIPYGEAVEPEKLSRIGRAESYLRQKGFLVVRVRHHNETARIEVDPEYFSKLTREHDEIARYFRELGFKYVALDLEGFRSGSLNEGLVDHGK